MADPPKVRTVSAFLVVSAAGEMRILKPRDGRPRLELDEVAFPVTVTIPLTWGRVQRIPIEVVMPEPPEARVTVGEPELAPDACPECGAASGKGHEDGCRHA